MIKLKYYFFNSDLADEIVEKETCNEYYSFTKTKHDNVYVSKVQILKYNKDIGKEVGDYISIDINNLDDFKEREQVSDLLASSIRKIIEKYHLKDNFHVLVVGLGNENVIADALGPETCKGVIVTNHLYEYERNSIKKGIGRVSMISPGVMGQTGLETFSIIKGIAKETKPDLVIAIDSLCSRSIHRINRVIQITDSGIRPGSGVGNNRKALTKATLGVPIVAIGVATVVEIINLVNETLASVEKKGTAILNPRERKEILKNLTTDEKYNMVVTPKEIDQDIMYLSTIIATGINKVLHNDIKYV
ncbi:MAG: GPR endopeptidase [Erysipelotrichaceae bacterium]|nr:GPR endopeptidase [Erysipelotrichaceae bacterium]